jgi:diguanylate cyclase (GGDEF)-like protein
MPRRVYGYVAAMCGLAVAVLLAALSLPGLPLQWSWWGAAVVLASMIVAEAGAVELTRDSEHAGHVVSVSTIPHVAAALLLPAWLAALLAGTAMLVDECRARRAGLRLAFNVACTTSSVGLAGLVAQLFGLAGDRLGNGDGLQLPALLAIVATYYVANTLPVAGVGALFGNQSFWRSTAQNARQTAPAMPALAMIGGLAAFVWIKDPHWLLVGLIPALVSQLTLRYVAARNRKTEHLAALDRLGRHLSGQLSVDEVFGSASEHLRQVRGVGGCFLLVDNPRQLLTDGLAADPVGREIATELAKRTHDTGQRVALNNAAADPALLAIDLAPPARSWLVLALRGHSGLSGCFGVVGQAPGAFSRDDLDFFELVADRVGLALEGARRAAELVRMAYHDPLTGLPNRALLLDRLDQVLARRPSDARPPAAMLLLDLDNFKLVNDSLGHQAGDALLLAVSQRLSGTVRPGDTVARLGGDEFVVMLPEVDGPHHAAALADRLARTLSQPFPLADREVTISVSIGAALGAPGSDRPEQLLRAADLALYRAKDNGRAGYALFDPDMETTAVERMQLESDLRQAIIRDELQVHYQPIVAVEDGKLVGWEALVRWQHPQRGMISPASFIPVAEDTGLIVPLGRWVLETACRQARAWVELSGDATLTMSVNLSARQFQDPGLIDTILQVVAGTQLPPHCLKLEITESAVMQDAEAAERTLRQLRHLGIQLAIDDFGTGYSSLAYLKRFQVDMLKIDRSFVNGVGRTREDTAIVRGVVALAKALELRVTAEGIETPTQRAQLRLLGCEFGQGYLFGRPQPWQLAEAQLLEQHPPDARLAA